MLLLHLCCAFAPPRIAFKSPPQLQTQFRVPETIVYSTTEDDEPEVSVTPETGDPMAIFSPPPAVEETENDFPIPLPSPILLGGSMVLAIVTTGRKI